MPNRSELTIIVLLAALTVVSFWPVLGCEFIKFDDPDYVTANPEVQRGLTWRGVTWAFTTEHAANWHPLTWLSLMLDRTLFGDNPTGYHAVNLALHVANVILVFLMLHRLTAPLGRASLARSALAAGLFAVHPLRVESVAWVSERKDVLSALFGLAAIVVYATWVRSPSRARYALVMLLYALSLMAKPMLVTLPMLLLLLDYWPLGRLDQGNAPKIKKMKSRAVPEKPTPKALVLEKVPLFALAVASCIITLIVQVHGKAVQSLETYGWPARLENALVSYVRYLLKMVDLNHLAFFYPYRRNWPLATVAVCAALLALSVGLVVWRRKNSPWLAVGWFWYLGLLVPVIGLVQVGGQSIADRYTYLPSIGVLLALVWSIPQSLFERKQDRVILALAAGCCLAALAVFTWGQVAVWHDSEILFRHAQEITENNVQAHLNLIEVLVEQHRDQEALDLLNPLIERNPTYGHAYHDRGRVYQHLGRYKDAIHNYDRAVELDPQASESYINRGVAYEEMKDYARAIESYNHALEIKPDYAQALYNRGKAYRLSGENSQAIADYSRAIALNPGDAKAYSSRAATYLSLGKGQALPDALADAERAIELDPKLGDAYINRAVYFFLTRQFDRAWADVRTARRLGTAPAPAFIQDLTAASGHVQ